MPDLTKEQDNQIAIKDTKKLILAAVLAAAAIAALVTQIAQKPASHLTLTAAENRFRVELAVPENQRDLTAQVLEKLTIPQDILGGFEFELDSTSSAKLAFATPIKTQAFIKDGNLTFTGKIKRGLPGQHELNTNLKIPKNTQIGVATGEFNQIIDRYLETAKLRQWFDANQKKRGQYLIIFGRDNFAIIIPKSGSLDFNSLAEAATSPEEEVYKQETFEVGSNSISLHSIKLARQNQYQLITLFELGEFLYLTSSGAAARDLINSQLGNAPSVNFAARSQTASFFAFWSKVDGTETPRVDVIFPSQFAKYLQNVKKANLEITGKNFSGSLELVE